DTIKYTSSFPKGAILFFEGHSPRGVFIIWKGRVKLSTCSSEGKVLITQIASKGEVIGLSAAVSGVSYEVTAETLERCVVNFVRCDDFLRFLTKHGEACLRVAQHLSHDYHSVYRKVRSLGLSTSAAEKLASLILDWVARDGKPTEQGTQIRLTLTHEEIGQMISTSRETVTRLLSDFKKESLIHIKGANLVVRDQKGLELLSRKF